MAYYESQCKPFPNKVCSFAFQRRKRLGVSTGGFSFPCVKQRAKPVSSERTTALHRRAGDRDSDKSSSGKFFSSALEWCKLIVFISGGAGLLFFFQCPFLRLGVNNTIHLLLLALQWTSERGRQPYRETRGWTSGKEIAGILLAHASAAVKKGIVG